MNLGNIMLSEEKPYMKYHILYDSIYMKYPEQANPKRQKADQYLPRDSSGAEGSEYLIDMRFTFGMMKIIWNLILMMVTQYCEYIKCHGIVQLKMVKMINFMSCVFYNNKNIKGS